MMNLLGLFLVVSSLVAAGVLSPNPAEKHKQTEAEVIVVKEGPRVVVVEYGGQEGHLHTKVKISPPEDKDLSHMMDTTKEKIKAGLSMAPKEEKYNIPRELVCDALGKCKHKIADAIAKAKDKVSEAAHEAKDKVQETVCYVASEKKEMAHEAREAVQDVAHEAKECVEDKLGEAKEAGARKAHDIKEGAKELVEKMKERVEDVKGAEQSIDKAKEKVKDVKDIGKTAKEDIKESVEKMKERVEDVKEGAKQSIDKAKEKVKDVKDIGNTAQKDIKGNVTETAKETKQATQHNEADVLRFMYSKEGLDSFMGVVQLLGFSMAYGMCVWVTFVSSYVLAEALPRQQFGVVQSKIYPVYFMAMTYSVGLALLGLLLGQRKKLFSNKVEMLQAYNLLASLLMVLTNAFYLEPRATKVMFTRMKIEKEEGALPENPELEVVRVRIVNLNARLKKLNSYSSFVNILTLMNLTWHLVCLGQRLHETC
ncbi:hypothetical protein HS088_TW08G00825 [Tripterygium wilfordii]|uniref:TMEM205-like domain-containing protein n=1 Tax=Tripterygium wilfordii TaxID=458696 RepID=A0A7J7DCZ7_TRIWF|nr:uncharacterized protein LOC120004627 [Tripterygium wilfordii]KAF5744227.1 hypothetical protein HS088_TW08G00825 [Tripterygium wilfordii]